MVTPAWKFHDTRPMVQDFLWNFAHARWDYGYQITAMGNRSVIVDNNTWNNTHIATVGRTMASNETEAQKLMHYLDADYALVIFGGMSGYQSDDINKWPETLAPGRDALLFFPAPYKDQNG
eukprot:1159320-Pelagomonas_calceolata.AAC.18